MAPSAQTSIRQGSLTYLLVIHQLDGNLNASYVFVRGRLYVQANTAASNAPLQPTLVCRVASTLCLTQQTHRLAKALTSRLRLRMHAAQEQISLGQRSQGALLGGGSPAAH